MRSLISLVDVPASELAAIVGRGVELGKTPDAPRSLANRAVGIYFRRTSTRTRTSFWRAATRLGADVITFGPEDLQLTTGESFSDTARVLSSYLDLLVVRTNGDLAELRELAAVGSLGIVNALTEYEHPTQAIADLVTLTEQFGDLDGRHLLYVGEGNSTAAALVHAAALTPGMRLTLLTPPGYGLPDAAFAQAEALGGPGSDAATRIVQRHAVEAVDGEVDAVYTSRWQTMGVQKADPDWMQRFLPYRVTAELFARLRAPHTVFLHDLPAIRGQEVTDEVLDGADSVAWRQAFHKMTAAMAVLEWCAQW